MAEKKEDLKKELSEVQLRIYKVEAMYRFDRLLTYSAYHSRRYKLNRRKKALMRQIADQQKEGGVFG